MSEESEINWYTNDTATFGDRVAAARENRQLSSKALARRLGAVPVWHFFDDFMTLGLQYEQGSGRQFLAGFFTLLGWPLGTEKHRQAATKQIAPGAHHDFTKSSDQDSFSIVLMLV